jgi:hypothetical protein
MCRHIQIGGATSPLSDSSKRVKARGSSLPPPMPPLTRLATAAASNGLLTGQILFSLAFVGSCELPNWISGPRRGGCRSALGSSPGADRRHHRPQGLGDLQLLLCPVGGEGGQEAVAIAVDSEHGVVRRAGPKPVPAQWWPQAAGDSGAQQKAQQRPSTQGFSPFFSTLWPS